MTRADDAGGSAPRTPPWRRALVLLSGGLDSTVALWWAAHAGYEPVALTFRYQGRPRGEARACADIVAASPATERHEADLPFLKEAADLDATRFAGAPPGYIPFRNALFYAAASFHAQALNCCVIVGGHNKEDGALYPDAAASFFEDLQRVLDRGAWRGGVGSDRKLNTDPTSRARYVDGGARDGDVVVPKLVMPLLELDRDEVLDLGERLGAPLDITWSCYEDSEAPCGTCPACARRGRGRPVARA